MKVSRAGAFRNLNVQPLIAGLELRDDFIVETVPRVVGLFEQGELEVALVPAIEIGRHDTWEVLLGCRAVGCDGPLRSTLVVARKPWDEVQRVALDNGSRAGSLLLQVLVAKHFAPGREVEFERVDYPIDHNGRARLPEGYDAWLVTGLQALKWPGYDLATGEYTPESDDLPPLLQDLGEAWRDYCGLPFVTSVWVARAGQDVREWHERVVEAAADGVERRRELAEALARRPDVGLPPELLVRYLTESISYEFGAREVQGLMRFLEDVASLGIAPVVTDRAVGLRRLPGTEPPPLAEGDGQGEHFRVQVHDGPKVDPLYRARLAYIRREYRRALTVLQDARDADPQFGTRPDVQLLRGRCNYHLMRLSEAKADLWAAARHEGTARWAKWVLARLYLENGRAERATDLLRELLATNGSDTSWRMHCHGLLATCAMQRGLHRSAEYWRELAEQIQLTSSELLVEHGRALMHEQLWDEAAAYFGEAVNVDPTNPLAYFSLANLFFLHGQYLKSEEILAYGLEQAQEEILFFALLGDLRRDQGKLADAVTLYRLALEISPRGQMADYLISQIATSLAMQGEFAEAQSHYSVVARHFRKSELRKECEYYAKQLAEAQGSGPEAVKRNELPNFPGGVQLPEHCGPKVVAAVLTSHGIIIDQSEIADEVLANGSSWHDLRNFAIRQGLKTIITRGNRELVSKLIDRGVPVVLCEYRGLDGHFLAGIGTDDTRNTLIVQDPNFQSSADVPWPEVLDRWRPASEALLVILPQSHEAVAAELSLADDPMLLKLLQAQQALSDDDHATARALGEEAAALAPAAEAPQKFLVELDLDEGRSAEAKARCEQVLERAPDTFWACKYLADAQLALEQVDTAIATYVRARNLYRDESALWWALGLALELKGNLVRARQCYRRSLELEMVAPVAVRLAQVLRQQGRPFEAVSWFEVAQELDPANEEAAAGLEWFDAESRDPGSLREKAFAAVVRCVPLGVQETETHDRETQRIERDSIIADSSVGEMIIDDEHDLDDPMDLPDED